ncbi:MAG TPA: hypothetical protein VGC69_03780 [Bordetella sp.]
MNRIARSLLRGPGGVDSVSVVNGAYQPAAVEVAWAERVIAAFEASRGAATEVDGKMIDKPMVARARRVMADHRQG